MGAVARSDPEILALLDVLARLRTLQSFPWRCLNSMEGRKGLAAVATLIGAGMMGAMMFVRGISTGALPWRSRNEKTSGSAEDQELTVPGLQNAGNNCFLNAILQALASSQRFTGYLKAYEHQIGDDDRLPCMPLSAALAELLQELAEVAPGQRTVSPRHVMRILGHYARSFDLAVQQDAAEALSHLATALQQERMEDFEEHKPALQSLANVSSLSRNQDDVQSKVALECWRQQLRWPMEGSYGSLLVCSQCGFQASMQFQFFRDVSLSPPQVADGFIKSGCTIEDCLEQYTTLERVSDFRCNRCSHLAAVCYLSRESENNKDILKLLQSCNYDDNCLCESLVKERAGLWFRMRGDAYKCLKIGRCPEVLCLHLQQVIVNSAGQLEKLMGRVSFSTALDLYPFTIAAQQTITLKQAVQPELYATMNYSGMKLSPLALLQAVGAKSSLYTRTKCIGGADASVTEITGDLDFDNNIRAPSSIEPTDTLTTEQCLSDFASTYSHEEQEIAMNCTEENPGPLVTSKSLKRQFYELISVVVHHGGPMSGHYTVYRKVKVPRYDQLDTTKSSDAAPFLNNEEQQIECIEQADPVKLLRNQHLIEHKEAAEDTIWFEISDATVSKVSEQEVLGARATLLFYELR